MSHLTQFSAFVVAVFLATFASSQHNNELYNNGSLIHIQAGAEVHVLGDVHMRGAAGILENYGLLKTDGDMYGDNLFQQRGTGTTRIQNNLVNAGQNQKISGSYAVRSVGSGNLGVNDGSFYNLELANGNGIVWLETNAIAGGTQYVADVRNLVDFSVAGPVNRIITHNPATIPGNGNGYSAVFGNMNVAAGHGSMVDNTVTTNGNMSGVDNGFVQGKLRKRINPAGGQYPFVLGLEPAGAGAQRGMQYIRLDFGVNNYDVIEGYFQTGLDNTFPAAMECSGFLIDYWGGVDHGQWIFDDATGAGTGSYTVTVWPQDDNFPAKSVWMVTKDNSIQGTPDMCGPSPIGLARSAFNGFSQFGVAAADVVVLPVELLKIWAVSNQDHIEVNWIVGSEQNVSHYELLRSEDGVDFEYLTQLTAAGNSSAELSYSYDDYNVLRNKDYYYRYRSVDFDGASSYSPIVKGRIVSGDVELNDLVIGLYPNPSNSNFNLSIQSIKDKNLIYTVMNTLGQVVQSEEVQIESGYTVLTINAEQWAPGMYSLVLSDVQSGERVTIKLIKN